MKNKLMKLFIGTTIWTIFFSCLAVYAANRAYHQDPEIVSKIGNQLGMTWTKSNFQFGDYSNSDPSFKETKDTWNFSLPAKNIKLRFYTGDIEISTTDQAQIQVIAEGGLDLNQAPHLVETDFNGDELMLSQPDGEAVRDLKIKVKIPKEYTHEMTIDSVAGSVYLLPTNLQTIKIRNVSGSVEAKGVTASDLQIQSVSGDINLEIKTPGMTGIKTVSGDVHLDMRSTKEKIDFDLGSVSGNISNALGSSSSSALKVMVKTTSGDIEIL